MIRQIVNQQESFEVVDGGADQVGGGLEVPPCIKIGYSSRLGPRAEKGPPSLYTDSVCFGNVSRYGIAF